MDSNIENGVFQVGDLVKIKDWSEMEREFGTDSEGDINVKHGFVPDMEFLCGSEFIITYINPDLDIVYGCFPDEDEYPGGSWTIGTEMIKHVDIDNDVDFDESDDLDSFLGEWGYVK